MTMRDRGAASAATQRSAAKPGHFGRSTGFVDEHEALEIKLRLRGAPSLSLRGDVGPRLLAGVRGFFERLRVAIEEPPDRTWCKPLSLPPPQMGGDLHQCDVGPVGNQTENLPGVGLDPLRALVAAL